MRLFWALILPGTFVIAALLFVRRAAYLQFFSRKSRDLDHVDIPNEVGEIRINELEMLVCDEADFMFKSAWQITRWQRRKAVTRRLHEVRKWLRLLISTAVLFQEVARFHIEAAASASGDSKANEDDLACKVLDHAVMLHLIAAACLAKLMLIDLCLILWPFYRPLLADRFQFRGHDLIAWYRHLAKDMLQLVQERYDDLTYTRFIFQLTGLFNVEEASRLNRL